MAIFHRMARWLAVPVSPTSAAEVVRVALEQKVSVSAFRHGRPIRFAPEGLATFPDGIFIHARLLVGRKAGSRLPESVREPVVWISVEDLRYAKLGSRHRG